MTDSKIETPKRSQQNVTQNFVQTSCISTTPPKCSPASSHIRRLAPALPIESPCALGQKFDVNDSESLSCDELCAAMRKLVPSVLNRCVLSVSSWLTLESVFCQDLMPRIHLDESDFGVITNNGELCDDKGMLGPHEFERAMRKQIRLYAQRKLADTLLDDTLEAMDISQVAALKILLREDHSFESKATWSEQNLHFGANGGKHKEDISDKLSGQMSELHRAVIHALQEGLSNLRSHPPFADSVKIDQASRSPLKQAEHDASRPSLPAPTANQGQSSNDFKMGIIGSRPGNDGAVSPCEQHSSYHVLVQPVCPERADQRQERLALAPGKETCTIWADTCYTTIFNDCVRGTRFAILF